MKLQERRGALSKALDRLESCLETPVLPGELPQWCQAATSACGEAAQCLRREVDQIHPGLFRQMEAEDLGMMPHIDAMRQEDKNLLAALDRVETLLHRLCVAAQAVEPHESRIQDDVQQAIDSGLELVLAVRKQERAITTWYVEALERDEGVAD